MMGWMQSQRRSTLLLGATVTVFAVAALILVARTGSVVGLFLTAQQSAERLVARGKYVEAAAQFSEPSRQGAALFRAGEFEPAAVAFARVNTAEGHFNQANSLVMLGKYDDALKAYDRSLERRAEWSPAVENREIARLRAERIKREGGDMTGGKLGADEIVIEPGKGDNREGQTEETAGEEIRSDEELQALWLRRVETRPADFLRAKFAFQLAAADADIDTESTDEP